jgi:phage shock protein B
MHYANSLAGIMFVPMILFLVIVCPLWMILHHLAEARRERNGGTTAPTSGEDQELMTRMVTLLEKMEGRIGALEKILDADHPRWRERP